MGVMGMMRFMGVLKTLSLQAGLVRVALIRV
jgi:hypothetical protein